MQSKPLVSFIVPTFNRANCLRQALNSILALDGIDEIFRLEVIIVDDASSDSTAEVVRSYPHVKYIRLDENRGAAVTRNVGIKASQGKYVTFLDDDDLVLPYKLVHQVPILEANTELGLAYSEMIVRYENGVSVWPEADNHPSGLVFLKMFLRPFTSTQTVLIRREALDASGWFDDSLPVCQDYDLMLRLSLKYPFAFRAGPVAIYRVSNQGLYLRHLKEGRYEESLSRVIQKAIALAVQSGKADGLSRRDVKCYVNLHMAQRWGAGGEPQLIYDHLLRTVRHDPYVVQDPSVRSLIAKLFVHAALRTNSPSGFANEFAKQLVCIEHDLTARRCIRNLVGEVWWRLALEFKEDRAALMSGVAAQAAANAIRCNPRVLGRTSVRLVLSSVLPRFSQY